MLKWITDKYKCWKHGHIPEEAGGGYKYCVRCGHLEIVK